MRATVLGFGAVLMWALLALFTVGTDPVPPLQLNAICFAIGGAIGLAWCAATGQFGVLKTIPLGVYAFGTVGLFGYHFFYFTALRNAPAAEAGLIAYLWPLLIVLMSSLLPGERLRFGHVIGAVLSFAGAALLIIPRGVDFDPTAIKGYGFAVLCALTWSSYSVLSRRLGNIPTASVTVFCLATAALSTVSHLALETTVWPSSSIGWLSIAGLGAFPVGAAFYLWDVGMKKGDIQLLGTASYAAPLLSTLVLIIAGFAAFSTSLIVAAILITLGAFIAFLASQKRA